jgi:hypothetical protein
MAKKLFLNRERAILTVVSGEEPGSEIASSSRSSLVAETAVELPFSILD